jgi:hypothetical protein
MGWLVADLAAKSQMTEAFLAAELVALKVDVILTGGTAQALAAKTLGPTIPPPLLQRADRVIE